MPKKNLVMGTGRSYIWKIFEPFVNSFVRNCSENAELVLFIDDISEYTRSRLNNAGNGKITLVPFPNIMNDGLPHNIRWSLFLDYLNEHGEKYDQVLVTDTRDVIFQSNVFKEFTADHYLGYTIEAENIRNNKLNYKWLVDCFGKGTADKLQDKAVVCCGTIIATVDEMKIFLKAMLKHLSNLKYLGGDQATENYIIHNKLVPIRNIIPIDCYTGAIFTAGIFNDKYSIKTRNGFILRGDGGIPAVVHQYDRSPTLTKLVGEIYCAKDFQLDKRFTDPKSLAEQLYLLAKYDKFESAVNFFATHFLSKADFKRYGNVFLEIMLLLPKKNLTAELEFFEISLQYAVMQAFSNNLNTAQIDKLYIYLSESLKNGKTITLTFRMFVMAYLYEMSIMLMRDDKVADAANLIDAALALNIPLPSQFYSLKKEIQRKLGK